MECPMCNEALSKVAVPSYLGNGGFNVPDYSDRWNIYLGTDYYGDYIPKHKKNISKQLNNMWDNYNYQGQYPFHYYGERITLVEALNL